MRIRIFCILLPVLFLHFSLLGKDSIRVAVYQKAPFGEKLENGRFTGLMVELWEDIAKELDYVYSYDSCNMEDLLLGLQEGRYDVGLGAISITPAREEQVDFTQPVNPSGTGIAVAAHVVDSGIARSWQQILWSLFRLLLILTGILLLASGIIWLVETRFSKNVTDRKITNLSEAFWWSAVTMSTVGYGDKVPDSWIGKALAMIWIFTSILLISLFTANASAILSRSQPEIPVQTEEDLLAVRVGSVANSSGEEFLIRENIPYQAYPTLDDAVRDLLDGKLDAVVYNVPVLLYMNKYKYPKQLAISRKLLLKNNMGIALQEESELREPIDRILLQKIAEPKWQKSVYRYLGSDFE